MRVFSVALLSLSLFPGRALAQCEITRLIPSNSIGHLGGFDGRRVSLVNGAYEIESFQAIGGAWANTGSFSPPGWGLFVAPTCGHFGEMIVAGREEDSALEGRVFVLQNGVPPATLSASDATGYDAFGSGLAIRQDLIVVGASMSVYDVGACGPGKGYVFERNASGWTETALFAPHGHGDVVTMYGFKLDTDGTTIVFGAPGDDAAGQSAGAVYVYERGGTGWVEVAKLTASDALPGFGFGTGVAVEGDQLLVGSSGAGASFEGAVYVFERQAAGWVETQILRAAGGLAGDRFGTDLDLDGDRAVVGATGVDAAFSNAGAIYTLEHDPGGWALTGSIVADDVTHNNACFGEEVLLSGNQVLWAGRWSALARLTSLGIENATVYCASSPNSSGLAARIAVDGCDSQIANALSLRASGLPNNTPGLFFFGSQMAQLPAGNGTLCVAGDLQRFAAQQSNGGGVLDLQVDFQSPRALALRPGSTWNFQVYFRDLGVGAGFDFSDAVALEIRL